MNKALALAFGLVQRHATLILAASLGFGLVAQDLAGLLRPLVFPLSICTMLLSLVRLDWQRAATYVRRPGPALAVMAACLLATPILVHVLIQPIGLPATLATGLTLIAGSAPLLSTPAYALLLGLDAPLAMVVALPATLVLPAILPPLLIELIGLDLRIDLTTFMLRLTVMVAVCFIGAALIRGLYSQAELDARARYFDGGVVLALVAIGIAVMDGIPALLAADPFKAILYVSGVLALSIGMLLLATGAALLADRLTGHGLDKRRAVTVGLLVGTRNCLLLLGALAGDAAPDIVLLLIAAQVPIYIMPLLLRGICRWLGLGPPAHMA
ncbi:MAG: hypothetical protein EXQ87_07715 [Alphaproteobacteria bacterium]|nr:hypothetical protein [Alphaproteobacteria bacterium]